MQIQAPVYELHPLPTRPLPKTPGEGQPLFVGDIVTVLFSRAQVGGLDGRGTITEMFRHDRYQIEIIGNDGEAYHFSAPRDLLKLVRRGDV